MLIDYSQAKENDRALHESQSVGLKAPEVWSLPPPGLAKLSTDAAIYLSNNKSGLPRILRNSNGDTITALAIPYPRTGQPQIQEAKALILSLKWFLSEEFPIHFTEMDCKNIIDALNSLSDSASIFGHLIALCRGTKISHVHRSANIYPTTWARWR
uniref:RNase H type-1 domain-containing protein n=1 Tax=Cannabis sativa TaxID=3483 RepID=A0A803PJ05_CANSA